MKKNEKDLVVVSYEDKGNGCTDLLLTDGWILTVETADPDWYDEDELDDYYEELFFDTLDNGCPMIFKKVDGDIVWFFD